VKTAEAHNLVEKQAFCRTAFRCISARAGRCAPTEESFEKEKKHTLDFSPAGRAVWFPIFGLRPTSGAKPENGEGLARALRLSW